jgi:radical SAM protein with 4Fe4S-binding SPASM domain
MKMKVILTNNPLDRGNQAINFHRAGQCDCDCDCACPTDSGQIPILAKPIAYYLELTPFCNNRCPGCGNVYAEDRGQQKSPLRAQNWKKIIASLANHTHELKLTGGEATLHPDFFEIIVFVASLSIPFVLFSNGRWADPDRLINSLLNNKQQSGLLISLHGANAATHDAFSGVPGSFEETCNNIQKLGSAGIDFSISFVINRNNWHQVEETLQLAMALNATQLVCNRYIGTPHPDISPTDEQLRATVQTIERLHTEKLPIRFGNCIPHCFALSSSSGCAAGYTFATIDPWGNVRPCNHAPWTAGNIISRPIEEIWQGEVMREWRSLTLDDCKSCAQFNDCLGGCRAQAILMGQPKDTLIDHPFEAKTARETSFALFKSLRPSKQFTVQNEGPQFVAIRKSKLVAIPAAQKEIIAYLDGKHTLSAIRNSFGQEALNWIGLLHQEGLVSLSE